MSAATTALTPETRELVLETDPEAERHCLVCYDVLEYATKTPCQHDEICGVCQLRIRFLHNDKKCPICKTENNQVIVDENKDPEAHAKTFDAYPIWGDDLGSDYVYRDDVGMFFRREYYDTEIQPLFGYHCTDPKCDYDGKVPDKTDDNNKSKTPIRGLQDHLRVKHKLALCQLCVDHQRDFVARLPRFTPNQLKNHLSKGDGKGSGFEGHPLCEFCRPKRFYDLNYLHQHLNKDHYKCHVCEQQGLANQFFKNYKSLEKHFDTQHFLCRDVQCLQARFVVFANELDLRHHERQVHGGTSTGSSKINIEFRVRRPTQSSEEVPSEADFNYNLDGQAFVPENLPQTAANNQAVHADHSDITLHPLHVQRTAQLREQAAEWRGANTSTEAFPTLEAVTAADGAAAAGNAPLRFGWASGATLSRVGVQSDVGAVTEEAFPSLGPSEGSSRRPVSAATAKLKPASRQFAAMRQAAAPPVANSWGGASTAAAPTVAGVSSSAVVGGHVNNNNQANLTADNFPSLGGGGGGASRQPYAAAKAFAKQQQQQKKAPSINSAADFPPPPTASQKSSVRDRVLGDINRGGAATGSANVLQGPSPSLSAKATVGDMKATLGSTKYKELKRMTAEFAGGSLDGQSYVDTAASLFDRGYADSDFWKFLPSLLASCPNEYDAQRALQYMEDLKRARNAAAHAETARLAPAPSGSGWKAPPSVKAAPSAPAAAGWNAGVPVAPAPPIVRPGRGAGPKQSAWGTGPAVAGRQPASAPAPPKTSTATKFMAKEAKQEKWQQANSNNKKKGKQKNELRDLAFGR